jgi:hypothetical protein
VTDRAGREQREERAEQERRLADAGDLLYLLQRRGRLHVFGWLARRSGGEPGQPVGDHARVR